MKTKIKKMTSLSSLLVLSFFSALVSFFLILIFFSVNHFLCLLYSPFLLFFVLALCRILFISLSPFIYFFSFSSFISWFPPFSYSLFLFMYHLCLHHLLHLLFCSCFLLSVVSFFVISNVFAFFVYFTFFFFFLVLVFCL